MLTFSAIKKDGLIYIGKRHHEILNNAKGKLKGGEQGFLTSEGKFVDRYEGAKLAFECGQIVKPIKMLTSEDLW